MKTLKFAFEINLYPPLKTFFFRFTQNLSVFRRDINDSLKGPNVTTTTVNDMMTS